MHAAFAACHPRNMPPLDFPFTCFPADDAAMPAFGCMRAADCSAVMDIALIPFCRIRCRHGLSTL
jgi:hypothetical protein